MLNCMTIQCYWCKKDINVRPSYIKGRKHKFCSSECNQKYRGSPEMIFWRYVQKTSGCWFWTGALRKDGYGAAASNQYPHRISYELHKGSIPEGLRIRHTCHVRKCVNPDHLLIGDVQDNSNDMVQAGRSLVGSRNNKAKILESDIPTIKELGRAGISSHTIAGRFGISYSAVRRILTGRSWRHI